MISKLNTNVYPKDVVNDSSMVYLYLKVMNTAYAKSHKGYVRSMNLGVRIPKSQWGGNDNWIMANDEISIQKIAAIRKLITGLEEIYWILKTKSGGKEPWANEIVNTFKEGFKEKERKQLLGQFLDEYVKGNDLDTETVTGYKVNFKNSFSNFLRIKLDREDMYLDEVTTATFYQFEVFMATSKTKWKKLFSPGTVQQYLNKFAALVTYAFKMGEISTDPGDQYISGVNKREELKSSATQEVDAWKIPVEDIIKIELNPISSPRLMQGDAEKLDKKNDTTGGDLVRTRLLFLFQSWSGFAYIDLDENRDLKLLIRNDLTGRKSIIYNRAKTGVLGIVPLFPQTIAILEALNYNVSPQSSYDTYNRKIKALLRYYSVTTDKDSTHVGRHIFGSRMLTMGFPMESVSRMMGHSSIRKTEEVYARVDMTKIYADYDKLKSHVSDVTKIAV
jgi:hypothetical protein